LFSGLSCPARAYCEHFAGDNGVRPHWQSLLSAFDGLGPDRLARYNERAGQMRREDGATINPFDEHGKRATSWGLDLLPLPITADEWSTIEAGLSQRAKLLERVLSDTYGPQNLLKSGSLPAELVYANPNFLHGCHNIAVPGNRYLTFYAADIYRAEDGRFRVFRDYGSHPAGLAYALENRIVMSRVVAELYKKHQILRLAPFFRTFQRTIQQRTSPGRENPGVVLLSPGPESSIYFEHALLSRYLGYLLVESQDLTVRNGKVYLKKLDGLELVEAVFRHIPDLDSDPFALRRETAHGVAGLIQVCRENNITMVNPVGSGFIDTPVLHTFLPGLAGELLGEELILQNHDTWWCGNSEHLAYIAANQAQLSPGPALDRQAVVDRSADYFTVMRSAPAEYMVSAPVNPSVAPGYGSAGAYSSYCMLRVFACTSGDGFAVMPGGLAITAPDIETLVSGSPDQQQSKDIWVISERPVETFTLMDRYRSVGEFKRSSDLPSRVADHLLWLGRYLERAERLVALLRPIFRRISGEDRPEEVPELQFLLKILEGKGMVATKEGDPPEQLQFETILLQLHEALYKRDRIDSVVSVLYQVQNAARRVRDRLSTDSSRIINHLEDLSDNPSGDALEFLDETLFTLSAFSGLAMESMTRSLGWRFMDMGRRIERAVHQTELISTALPLVCANPLHTLEALLEISDSTMTYRSRYRSAFQLAPVLDLLLADENNPKSLAFQFSRIAGHVEYLPRQSERSYAYREERIALQMLTAVRLLDLTTIDCGQNNGVNAELESFLQLMLNYLQEFAQEVTGHYLTRIPATPHFSVIPGERP
jgi:uncharacterized circularly permuted ATP-grasp superfamily protein/uncharacterized alpha-E superfamily protein